ncbi:MAG: FecR domain-containing protein [Opitutaceae bacterium]|nr:FecR domain-containing protein [Opitutaceae bacterium]
MTTVLATACLLPVAGLGQTRAGGPAGKLYVAEMEGASEIDSRTRIQEMVRKAVYDADDSIIQTKAGATNTLVFSNGVGIFLDPETTLQVDRFTQQPFQPNRADLELEPSVSRMFLSLRNGSVALCTGKMLPGSILEVTTPHATVSIRGKRVVIQTNVMGTTVSLLEGDVTARLGADDASGQVLLPNQRAIIRQGRLGDPLRIVIEPIPEELRRGLEDRAAFACMARHTVYFDTEEGTPGATLRARPGISVFSTTEPPDNENVEPIPGVPPVPEIPTYVSPSEIPRPPATTT